MTIVEVKSTVSYQYYMRKTKRDIIFRLAMLHSAAHDVDPPQYLKEQWDQMSKSELADLAMNYHRMLPEDAE